MGNQVPPPTEDELTDLERLMLHNRRLLHALQTAHPVLYQGLQRFIHSVLFHPTGGNISAVVYLTGSSEPLDGSQVTLQPRPRAE